MARKPSPDLDDSDEDSYDPQEHQACYVFTSTNTTFPPPKRRKIAKPPPAPSHLFPDLLNRKEPSTSVQLRWDTYQALWAEQEARTKAILSTFNQATLDSVSGFVAAAEPAKYGGKIPTALVLAGPNIASHGPLFRQFARRLGGEDQSGPVVVLGSKDAGNLKQALKKVIRDATQAEEGVDDEDEELIVGRKGAKLLNYDLQILQNWCNLHEGKKVVVAVQDTEAFDTGVLSDLVSLFSSYLDRIPFVLLLGIATSLEIFHEKLPKATIRMLQGEKFDVERAEECLAQVFNDAVITGKSALRFGPSVCDLLMERQRDHTQSIQTFVAALKEKYMYMSHFYANPLSVILACLDGSKNINTILSKFHLQAIRNLPSFRQLVTSELSDKNTTEVRDLLQNDIHLRSRVKVAITESREYGEKIGQALSVFEVARNSVSSSSTRTSCNELYSRALSGDFNEQSPMVRDLLLIIKKMKSGPLLSLLSAVLSKEIPALTERLTSLRDNIQSLVANLDSGKSNLTSEFDVADTTLRTTAVSRRIQLNDHKSGLTKTDTAYSKFIQQVHDTFEEYFADSLKPVKHLFLHEVFFYNLVSPHKDVFAPRARATVERALSNPAHYLGCECCEADDAESVLKGTNPPTSIVYQLFLESGALINAFDLWNAFRSVLQENVEDEEGVEDDVAQALFFRSVAEMRFLGFVKPTRKRVDHLQKIAWKGL